MTNNFSFVSEPAETTTTTSIKVKGYIEKISIVMCVTRSISVKQLSQCLPSSIKKETKLQLRKFVIESFLIDLSKLNQFIISALVLNEQSNQQKHWLEMNSSWGETWEGRIYIFKIEIISLTGGADIQMYSMYFWLVKLKKHLLFPPRPTLGPIPRPSKE